jgi:Xaa-Pro aminopeptidase
LTKTQNLINALNVNDECLLITSDINRAYFCGFADTDGYLAIFSDKAFMLTDSRFYEAAAQNVTTPDISVLKSQKPFEQINELLKSKNCREILLENDNVTLTQFNKLKEKFPDCTVKGSEELSREIKLLRAQKSETELQCIKKAQSIAETAFNEILSFIKPGIKEIEIAAELEYIMRRNGSEGTAFDTIALGGKNTSVPHGVPGEYEIQTGDFVLLDYGATYEGYKSDMTRTVAVGSITQKQSEVYEIVLKAQKAALSAIRPGVICKDIDKAARDIIKENGYGENFGHGLGHSAGLEIHEAPNFNTRDETILKPGHIMTVEPGIYIENTFGVRIEDMVYITSDNYLNLTKADKSLIIL